MKHERISLPKGRPAPGKPCRILIDAYGVPHLYAENEQDLFFLQGFNAARDRLWQIDLWYKRGLGRLAKNFGEAFLVHDIAARKLLYRGDLDKEWAAYGPDAKAIFGAFVDGVNAFIALTRSGDQPLPAEFAHTRTEPDFWTADEAITIRFHGLMQNVEEEVARARLRADGNKACERFLGRLQPSIDDASTFTRAEADLLEAALAVYRHGVDPISFGSTAKSGASDPGGSNAWAIAGARTPSGKPILASDPHRALTMPSLRYLVGLHAPGLDLIGGGEPMQPGVSIGHNGTAAFGLTIFPADQEDFVLIEGDGVAVTTVREPIEVRGRSEPVMTTINLTPVGPILASHEKSAVALQSVWFEPGAFPYLQSLRYRKARSLAEFSAAAAHWGCPAVNLIYADEAGDIARLSTGFMPKRRQNGLVPRRLPDDARWDGVFSIAEETKVANPASGYVHTANEFNLPDKSAREKMLGFEWSESSRARRIKARLGGNETVTIADSLALQLDKTSLIAERVLAFAAKLAFADERVEGAIKRLSAWDAVLDPESREAALFEIWHVRHLKPVLVAHAAGRPFSMPRIDNEVSCDFLESLGSDKATPLIETTLGAALDELAHHDRRLGKEARWGDLHHALFAHPLSGQSERFPVVGPLRQGGSESTVFHSGFDAATFVKLTGSTFRIVIDLADLDKSFWINAPGQSGDSTSPFYDAMAPLWAKGQVVPLASSAAAVRKAAEIEIDVVSASSA
ncbi:penicillin acylase family protein [Taklimakanibacter deserti]|uniref:penicillin acylase family protein n=1 Tax=Taklimakanibacter deserti TaxID=2267839 RepID=UPI000E649F23